MESSVCGRLCRLCATRRPWCGLNSELLLLVFDARNPLGPVPHGQARPTQPSSGSVGRSAPVTYFMAVSSARRVLPSRCSLLTRPFTSRTRRLIVSAPSHSSSTCQGNTGVVSTVGLPIVGAGARTGSSGGVGAGRDHRQRPARCSSRRCGRDVGEPRRAGRGRAHQQGSPVVSLEVRRSGQGRAASTLTPTPTCAPRSRGVPQCRSTPACRRASQPRAAHAQQEPLVRPPVRRGGRVGEAVG